MTLSQKLQRYKKIRCDTLPPKELTYENVLQGVQDEYAKVMRLAKDCGIRIKRSSDPDPKCEKSGVFNTDIVASLGHALAHPSDMDSADPVLGLLEAVKSARCVGFVTSTIFLEVVEGRIYGDEDSWNFMVQFCILLDSGDKLEEIARLALQYMLQKQ